MIPSNVPAAAREPATTMVQCVAPSVAIVVNARFIPASPGASHAVGASGFVVSASDLLSRNALFNGFIVYERDDALSNPTLGTSVVHGHPAISLRFNFQMSRRVLQDAMRLALQSLAVSDGARGTSHAPRGPVPYYQSNTMLPFHPDGWPFLVTHHGPFAEEICRLFGRRFAADAFRGGMAKVDHLVRMQSRGVGVLRTAPAGLALEMSSVQDVCLRRAGVDMRKVVRIAPPLDLDVNTSGFGSPCGHDLASSPEVLHLVTMVARADRFKNLERLVRAANHLTRAGLTIQLSVFAGTAADATMRAKLMSLVSAGLRSRTRIAARMDHEHLAEYMRRQRALSVFVCTSLYETMGLTPLEAMLSGMVTLVPNSPAHIGVVEYVLERHRYHPSVRGLTEALHHLWAVRRDLTGLGHQQREYSRQLMLGRQFLTRLRKAAIVAHRSAGPSRLSRAAP